VSYHLQVVVEACAGYSRSGGGAQESVSGGVRYLDDHSGSRTWSKASGANSAERYRVGGCRGGTVVGWRCCCCTWDSFDKIPRGCCSHSTGPLLCFVVTVVRGSATKNLVAERNGTNRRIFLLQILIEFLIRWNVNNELTNIAIGDVQLTL
jgi:hypothetical protein